MKIGDAMKKCSNRPFRFRGLTHKDFAPLRNLLVESGYTQEGVFGRLQAQDLYETSYLMTPVYNEIFLKEDTPLNILMALFYIFASRPEEKVRRIMGDDLFDMLIKVGILEVDEYGCKSNIDIFPCRGRYIATDHRYETLCPKNTVYPLGVDSYGLARAITGRPYARVLDLCTGSGIQGIMAAGSARQVTCVDINQRALEFVKLNAMINGLTNVRTVKGNLYEAVAGEEFDLILANPPFVPSPEEDRLLFRDGSASGDSVLREIVAGLPRHLAPGGLSQIYTLIPVTDGNFNDRVKGWLQDGSFHVMTMVHLETNNFWFLKSHVNPVREANYYDKLVRWMQSLIDEGIKKVSYGIINIAPAVKSPPQYRHKDYQLVPGECSYMVDIPMNMLDRLNDPEFHREIPNMVFRFNEKVDRHWEATAPDGSHSYGVRFAEGYFFEHLHIDQGQKMILDLVTRGMTRGEKIQEEYKKAGGNDFIPKLADLLENLVLMAD